MPQSTETMDKLYLEWSQFTKAKTKREVLLEGHLQGLLEALDDIFQFDANRTPIHPGSLVLSDAKDASAKAREFLRNR